MGLSAFTDGLMSGLNTVAGIKNAKSNRDFNNKYLDLKEREIGLKQKALDDAPNPDDMLSMFSDVAFGGGPSLLPRSSQANDPVMLKPLTERPTYGMGAIKGYAQGGLVNLNDGIFSGGVAPSSSGLTALAAPPQPPPQQAQPEQPQDEQLTPRQRLTKALLTTDVLSNPDKLSKIQAIADMHGMGKVVGPWLERAYTAKKQGMIDGAMQLMQGRVDDAIDSLARGGVKLADRPEPADPKNPRLWKINIEGAGERTMDIGDLLQSTMEPPEFLKHDLAKNESQGKRNVSDSAVKVNESQVEVNKARVGKLGEETKGIRAERATGGLSGGPSLTKLPAPVATAEWLVQKGVYKNHKDAFAAVKTLNDKSPDAQRQELIKARMQGGLTSLADAAKEVDEFMAQEGGGATQGTPAPTKKVLIFGKDFK